MEQEQHYAERGGERSRLASGSPHARYNVENGGLVASQPVIRAERAPDLAPPANLITDEHGAGSPGDSQGSEGDEEERGLQPSNGAAHPTTSADQSGQEARQSVPQKQEGRSESGEASQAPGKGPKPKLPRPEGVQPCPRCASQSTKFCYYNNYNIKQPRYFCRACQRYWTAGGALRDVPVGAGRRKTKTTKPDGTTDPASAAAVAAAAAAASLAATLPLPAVLSQVPGLMMDPTLAAAAAYAGGPKPGGPLPPAPLPGILPAAMQLPGVLPPQVGAHYGMVEAAGAMVVPSSVPSSAAVSPQVPKSLLGGPLSKLTATAIAQLPGDPAAFDLRGPSPVDGAAEAAAAQVLPRLANGLASALAGAALPDAAVTASLPAGAAPPAADGSVDGRRTRLKTEASAALAAALPPSAVLPMSALANTGLAGALVAAASSGAVAASLAPSPPSVAFNPQASFFGAGAARFGAGEGSALGAAHLGTAGPLSSEFFAHAAAGQGPHVSQHPQHVAAAAMHAQSLHQLHAGAGATPFAPPPYGMGSLWPYGGLGSFGAHSWPGAHHAAAAQSFARYPPPGFAGLPPAGPLGGHPQALSLGLGGPLGHGHPGTAALTPADVAHALAQVPTCGAPPAAPLPWSGLPDMGSGWGGLSSMAGAINPALTASAMHHHQHQHHMQQAQIPGGGFGLGAMNALSMVPASAAPSSSLLAAAAAAAAASPDAVVPA